MSLINDNTRWVLFLSAKGDPEQRHIMDLAFGVLCLERAGVKMADISIYVDGADRVSIESFIKHGTNSPFSVKTSDEFFIDQTKNTHDNLVMFVTGHGDLDGISAAQPITPYKLLNSIKSSPNLKRAVVYLGQCYAGIFNYIGAGSKKDPNGNPDPEVIFIGATNLHESISSSTQETFVSGSLPWLANLFLLFAFKWFSNPVDVDGDGKFTVIDSYKYAGVLVNAVNKKGKTNTLALSVDLQAKWIAAKEAHDAAPNQQSELAQEAAFIQYSAHLSFLHVHQECWILNAVPAQNLER